MLNNLSNDSVFTPEQVLEIAVASPYLLMAQICFMLHCNWELKLTTQNYCVV